MAAGSTLVRYEDPVEVRDRDAVAGFLLAEFTFLGRSWCSWRRRRRSAVRLGGEALPRQRRWPRSRSGRGRSVVRGALTGVAEPGVARDGDVGDMIVERRVVVARTGLD